MRHLVLVLGDQLDDAALDGVDSQRDAIWMAEVREETEHVWAHKRRIAAFFAAMRHHRDDLRKRGFTVHYTELPARRSDREAASFAEQLRRDVRRLAPQRLVVVQPGDHRVLTALQAEASALGLPLDVRPDRHFLSSPDKFAAWATGRRRLVMDHFYRTMRVKHRVLVTRDGKPVGGRWSFDAENRASFGRTGPKDLPPLLRQPAGGASREVLALVAERFADHPGSLDDFDEIPVTRAHAARLLEHFVEHRLPTFGRYQDAMWAGEAFLYHSRLSFALNLKLIHPRACIDAAVAAYEAGHAPLASVEGFVRQILGWREFVRGVYWTRMPAYQHENALGCDERTDVPSFYWDGQTDMACVADAMRSLVAHGYTHHIQRLMVLGLFAQLAGVHPLRFHQWHMAMYLDAIDWVSLPNALGMSQYGDGGVIATKPYVASGAYINRMSNHCRGCGYDPRRAVGDDACPFNALYWDFLARHRDRLTSNERMTMQLANLARKPPAELAAVLDRAALLKARVARKARI